MYSRARCTSAAPWYFRPKALKYLGTFQDGGLRHNNPIALALWESRAIWPEKGDADIALSLGTGVNTSASLASKLGPFSPVRDRFLPRLFKTFMVSIDGEKAWHEVLNTVSSHSKTRLHRLNLSLEDRYLSLDDVNNITHLQEQALAQYRTSNQLEVICNSILASMFYFELDDIPAYHSMGIACKGTIYCRLDLPFKGRQALYSYLKERNAFFLVNGRPLRAVDAIPKYAPPLRKKVVLHVTSYEDTVGISLRHSTMPPLLISGLPKTVDQLLKMQMLETPFGRPDHQVREKQLPQTPCKRDAGPPVARAWTLRSSVKRIRLA